jgi:hypothetical protein
MLFVSLVGQVNIEENLVYRRGRELLICTNMIRVSAKELER